MVKDEECLIIFDQEQMVGKVVGERDLDASDLDNPPNRESLRQPDIFSLENRLWLEVFAHAAL